MEHFLQSYEWDQLTSSWIATAGDWNSGPVPQVAVGTGISPDKADLTFTAYSPTSGVMYDFQVSASTLTLTGQLPIAGDDAAGDAAGDDAAGDDAAGDAAGDGDELQKSIINI